MQLHQVKRNRPRHRDKIVGRGGKRGTTSGRGTKGQRARSGHRIRPESRDVIKRLPKKRGWGIGGGNRSLAIRKKLAAVTLADLTRHFATGETVSPATLAARRLVSAGVLRCGTVKIIGSTVLAAALTVENCLITPSARQMVEKAGGKVVARQDSTSHVK